MSARARLHFSARELAILHVCPPNGWTLSQWEDLSAWEQLDWLAYDCWRSEQIAESVHQLIAQDKYTPETYAMMLIARL